jgi:ABC-type multidrug transport system fused ATPase/permease subunit
MSRRSSSRFTIYKSRTNDPAPAVERADDTCSEGFLPEDESSDGQGVAAEVQLAAAQAGGSPVDLDDHSARAVPRDLLWVWREILPRRRKRQGLLVLALMLLGGFAELSTLGAAVPLLALFASSGTPHSPNRVAELLLRFGINLSDYSLTTLAFIFCSVAVVTGIIRIVLAWAGQKYVFAIRHDIGVALYDRMLHQPYMFHVGVNSSRIISSLENVPRLASGMLMPMLQGGIAIFIGLFVVGGLVMLSPFAATVAILGFGLIYGGLSLTAGRGLRRNAQVLAKRSRERLQTLQEGLGGIGDVLLDNTQALYVRKFARIDRELSDAQSANALVAVTPRFVAEAVGVILMVSLAVVLNRQVGGAAASLPILGALALGAQRLLPLMQQCYFGWASLLGHRSLFFDIVGLLQRPVTNRAATEPLPPFRSNIGLKRIGFEYSSDRHFTLTDVTLEIPTGSRVGFVGKTGSGKTTLVNIIMGLLDPTSGEMRVDGHLLTPSNKGSWQKQVAHVPQFIFLTDGSIAENVAFGISPQEIDFDKLRRVCGLADIAEFIESLPRGYSTSVGERGVRLSGGQIQRIGLARALYKDATVLVLDEATSALDDATEANIIDAVQRLGRTYTVLMIAHRTSTLRECDIVHRLDSGVILESRSPEQLFGPRVTPIKPAAANEQPLAPKRRRS